MLPVGKNFDPNKDVIGKAKAIFNFKQRKGRISYTFSSAGDFEGSFADYLSKLLRESVLDPLVKEQPTIEREHGLNLTGHLTLAISPSLNVLIDAKAQKGSYLHHTIFLLQTAIAESLVALEEGSPELFMVKGPETRQ